MYEAVSCYPEGDATLSRLAATAARQGYDGLVARGPPGWQADVAGAGPAAVREAYGIDIVPAVEIDTDDPSVLAGSLAQAREAVPIVIVRGGTERINRQAVEDPRVDVLSAPLREDGDVNHVLAAAAARNGVHLEYNLGPVLRGAGGGRVRALSGLRKLREVATDGDAPVVVSADPRSHLQLRAPRELVALGETIGFASATIADGLIAWSELAARNRRRLSGRVIEPGVEIEDTDGGGPP